MIKTIRQLYRTVQRPPIKVVKAIIVNEEGKILILRRSRIISIRQMSDLPGGVVDRGENLKVALQREVYEETALKILKPRKLTSSRSMSIIGPIHMHIYTGEATGTVSLSWEHDRSWWVDPVAALKQKSLPKPYRVVIDRYLQAVSEVF